MKNKLTDNNSYAELKEYILIRGWGCSTVTSRRIQYENGLHQIKNKATKHKHGLIVVWLRRFVLEFGNKSPEHKDKPKAIALLEDGVGVGDIHKILEGSISRTTLYKYKLELGYE